MTDDEFTTDKGMDAGGRAHSELDEPHPGGDDPRSDRETGGPTGEGESKPVEEDDGAIHGTKESPFDSHE
jgi:hypothetical protein